MVINADLVRALFGDEPTRSCALVFDDKYSVSVSGTLKEVESKLRSQFGVDNKGHMILFQPRIRSSGGSMACYAFFHTGQNPKQEVVINPNLVRAVFWDEPTRSCTLVFDDKYAVSVSGTLKEVESKLRGTSTIPNR